MPPATGPWCRRPAAASDFEHNIPYEAGGRTCLCNAGPKCGCDHRLKQDPRWHVDQLPDGTFRWTTPTGRQYVAEPTRYPILFHILDHICFHRVDKGHDRTMPSGFSDTYLHGHHDSVLRSHRWRTAENSAAYLLAALVPDSRLLDVGCGPGSVTIDLAARLTGGWSSASTSSAVVRSPRRPPRTPVRRT